MQKEIDSICEALSSKLKGVHSPSNDDIADVCVPLVVEHLGTSATMKQVFDMALLVFRQYLKNSKAKEAVYEKVKKCIS